MKRLITLAMALMLTFMVVGCGAQESSEPASAPVKQTATAHLDQEGTTVDVCVDLSDGWSCEFARGAVYLYEGENAEGVEAVAIGETLAKDVYEDYIKGAKDQENFKEIENGVAYTDANGESIYCFSVEDKAYFMIDVTKGADAEAVYNRIQVSLEQ